MNENYQWKNIFCGREKELQFLINKWKLVTDADMPKPQMIVLTAERGRGKTRLVQEFYGWLTGDYDPNGYWPKRICEPGNNLRINPDFDNHEINEPVQVPFLWWGIRFTDPCGRNVQDTEALNSHFPHLIDHLRPMFKARFFRSVGKSTGWMIAESVADIAAKAMADYAMLGLIGKGKDIYDLIKSGHAMKKSDHSISKSVQESKVARNKELVKTILSDFDSLFSPPEEKWLGKIRNKYAKYSPDDMSVIPAVIILDDAHWADKETLRFLKQFFQKAWINDWPILVIATHWHREWKTSWGSNMEGGSFAAVVKKTVPSWAHGESEPLNLGKVGGLEEVLFSVFPGISMKQFQLLVEKADGNPQMLNEIIYWLKRNSRLFAGKDVSKSLTEFAEGEIAKKRFNLHFLIEDRFASLPEVVKETLGWGSVQGIRFINCLIESVICEMIPSTHQVIAQKRIEESQNACFVNGVSHFSSEFLERSYFDIASDYINILEEDRVKVLSIMMVEIEKFIENHEIWTFPDAERDLMLKWYIGEDERGYAGKKPWLILVAKYFYEFPARSVQALHLASQSAQWVKNNSSNNGKGVYFDVPAGPTSDNDEMSLLHNLFLDALIMSPDPVKIRAWVGDLAYLSHCYAEYYSNRIEIGFSVRDDSREVDSRVVEISEDLADCCEKVLCQIDERFGCSSDDDEWGRSDNSETGEISF